MALSEPVSQSVEAIIRVLELWDSRLFGNMAGHDGNLSTSLTLGLGLLAATMTLITAGSVGLVGFMLGRQLPQQEMQSSSKSSRSRSSSKHEHVEQERRHRLRIPSGTASEDVKITDKKAIMDVRISGIRPLISPAILLEEIPLTTKIVQTVRTPAKQTVNSEAMQCID